MSEHNPRRGFVPGRGRGRGSRRGSYNPGGARGRGNTAAFGEGGAINVVQSVGQSGSVQVRRVGPGSRRGTSPQGRAPEAHGQASVPPGRGRGSFPGGGRSRGGRSRGAPPADSSQLFVANVPAIIDERLATYDSLVKSFVSSDRRPELPLPPPAGLLGEQIVLRSNSLPVQVGPQSDVLFDYEIKFPPTKDATGERKTRIFQLLEQHTQFSQYVGFVSHDGSQRLVSRTLLPQPLTIDVQLNDERDQSRTIAVEILFKQELNMDILRRYTNGELELRNLDTQPYVSALNLVIQQHARKTGVRIGKDQNARYFMRSLTESAPVILGGGLEAWRGFFISVRPRYKQVMVNVNTTMAPFYLPGNLAERMFESMAQSHGLVAPDFGNKLKVFTTYLPYSRKWTIQRVLSTSATRTTFLDKETKQTVSVAAYFARKYPNCPLKYADNLPVVCVREKPPVYIPPELCEILPDQPYFGRLHRDATTVMIEHASKPPKFNADMIISDGFEQLGLGTGSDAAPSAIDRFGVTVARSMTVVPGRILPPPTPTYGSGRLGGFRPGTWNFAGLQFKRGANVSSWVVILLQEGRTGAFIGPNDARLMSFLTAFANLCRTHGIDFTEAEPTILSSRLPFDQADPHRKASVNALRATLESNITQQTKPDLLVALLASDNSRIYSGLKRICDMQLGVHSVSMHPSKAMGRNAGKQTQYFANIALKVNAKLDGVNHVLDSQSIGWLRNTMVMGIDVTHPGPGSKPGSPSLVAVVASVDGDFTNYPAQLVLQKPAPGREAKEVVESLHEIVANRLRLYKEKNGTLPEKVIVFRDGVSEGQYRQTIIEQELPKIKDAFLVVSEVGQRTYSPKLTIVVCGKRHHTRFYPTDVEHMTPNGNTKPGTVVDKGVTDVFLFDFYLQPHIGLQGTVRPTHYVVVYDENTFDSDTLQQGIHTLSYLYPRASKSVSLVPPAYLADLACERARCYLDTIMNERQVDSPESQSGKGKSRAKGKQRADEDEKERVFREATTAWGAGVHPDIRNSMFYI